MNKSAPSVARLETIAAAAGSSLLTMRRRISAGQFPPANVRLPGRGQERGWSLPTIAAHDPALADRVKRIIVALEVVG